MQYAGMLLSTGLAVTEIHMPQLRYYSAGAYGLCRQFFWCKSNVYLSIAFFFFSLPFSLLFCRFYIMYREKLIDYYLFCFLFSFLEFFLLFVCLCVLFTVMNLNV